MKQFLIFIITMIIMMVLFVSGAMSEDAITNTTSTIIEKYGVIIGMVILLVEYILGKTTWIKPNSILELIIVSILKFLKALAPESKNPEIKN